MKRLLVCLMAVLLMVGMACAEEDTWLCPLGHTANHFFCSWCGAPRNAAMQDAADAEIRLQLGQVVHLDGIGDITPLRCEFYDILYEGNHAVKTAGNEQFVLLELDILNTNRTTRGYLVGTEVTAVYDVGYVYQGEAHQMQEGKSIMYRESEVLLDPMYNSSYAFACKLPNAVVNGTGPLQLILTLDGVQLTYQVR